MSNPKPPTPVRVGMKADEVLKLRGLSRLHAIGPAEWLEYGQSAIWHYADCDVVLARQGDDGVYRVVEMVEKGEDEE